MFWSGLETPDLNPIENLWFRLKRIVRERHPTNKRQLIEAKIFAWSRFIIQDELVKLVDSMPAQCRAVICAQEYPTKYRTLTNEWKHKMTLNCKILTVETCVYSV
jgi:hypothetical protein